MSDDKAPDAQAAAEQPAEPAEQPAATEAEDDASGRAARDETREAVLDLARGEVNDEDLDALEAAIDAVDFAARRATPEVIARLDALRDRLADVVEQVRQGTRKPVAETEPLSPEALEILHNLVEQGITAGEKGNLHEARESLEQALQLHPDSSDVLFNLGVVYGMLAHHNIARAEFYDDYVRDEVWIDKAHKCYAHLLELEPDHLPSLINLATLQSVRGVPDEAAVVLRRILEVKPQDDHGAQIIARARSQLAELESI